MMRPFWLVDEQRYFSTEPKNDYRNVDENGGENEKNEYKF